MLFTLRYKQKTQVHFTLVEADNFAQSEEIGRKWCSASHIRQFIRMEPAIVATPHILDARYDPDWMDATRSVDDQLEEKAKRDREEEERIAAREAANKAVAEADGDDIEDEDDEEADLSRMAGNKRKTPAPKGKAAKGGK